MAGRDGGALDGWSSQRRVSIDRTLRIVGELRAAPDPDLAMLTVAARELRALARI